MSLIHENISFTAREKPLNTNENSLEIFPVSAAKFCSNYQSAAKFPSNLRIIAAKYRFCQLLLNFREFRQITFALLLRNTVGN